MTEMAKIINDVDGYIIISLSGKEFISREPIQVTAEGKFHARDIDKLVFERTFERCGNCR
jgi:hypothetical protein